MNNLQELKQRNLQHVREKWFVNKHPIQILVSSLGAIHRAIFFAKSKVVNTCDRQILVHSYQRISENYG